MSRIFRHTPEFKPTIEAAAERLNISATAIEKDYWVSEVLRVLAARHHGNFLFKGGTSLSKAFQIVDRFSEDVDILIFNGGASRGVSDRLMKQMGRVAAEGVGAPQNQLVHQRPVDIVRTRWSTQQTPIRLR